MSTASNLSALDWRPHIPGAPRPATSVIRMYLFGVNPVGHRISLPCLAFGIWALVSGGAMPLVGVLALACAALVIGVFLHAAYRMARDHIDDYRFDVSLHEQENRHFRDDVDRWDFKAFIARFERMQFRGNVCRFREPHSNTVPMIGRWLHRVCSRRSKAEFEAYAFAWKQMVWQVQQLNLMLEWGEKSPARAAILETRLRTWLVQHSSTGGDFVRFVDAITELVAHAAALWAAGAEEREKAWLAQLESERRRKAAKKVVSPEELRWREEIAKRQAWADYYERHRPEIEALSRLSRTRDEVQRRIDDLSKAKSDLLTRGEGKQVSHIDSKLTQLQSALEAVNRQTS